jgi:hypothetical protein
MARHPSRGIFGLVRSLTWPQQHHVHKDPRASLHLSMLLSDDAPACRSLVPVGGLEEDDRGELLSEDSCSVLYASSNRQYLFDLEEPVRRVTPALGAITLVLLEAKQSRHSRSVPGAATSVELLSTVQVLVVCCSSRMTCVRAPSWKVDPAGYVLRSDSTTPHERRRLRSSIPSVHAQLHGSRKVETSRTKCRRDLYLSAIFPAPPP